MRFKGDIIITDPCYICRERAEVEEYPKAKDYFSYDEKDDYPDYRKMDKREIEEVEKETGFPRWVLPDERIHKSDQYAEENKRYEAALQEYRKNNVYGRPVELADKSEWNYQVKTTGESLSGDLDEVTELLTSIIKIIDKEQEND